MGKIVGTCNLCDDGKEYKNLEAHLRLKHGITYDEYVAKTSSSKEEKKNDGLTLDVVLEKDNIPDIEELPEVDEGTITPDEMAKRIFDLQETDSNMLLSDFLKEMEMTEKSLRNLIDRYKNGAPIDITQQMEERQKKGEKDAERLSKEDTVETTNVATSENLVKNHGYEVVSVKSGSPRRWVLKRK